MAEEIPQAPEAYDRSNEQRTRSSIEERLSDIETKLYALQTTYGTLSIGEGDLTLVNGANDNVSSGYQTYVRVSGPSSAFSVTGIAGGERGRILFLRNTTAQAMTVSNESGSSNAQNRILTQTGSDFVTTAGGSVVLVYDATDQRWIVVASQT